MSFDVSNLLLTDEKKAQLAEALSNLDVDEPLEMCITEATAEAARLTTGYVIDTASTNGFIRPLALFKAYSLAGPVPDDVQKQYDEAMKELQAIAKGDRKNLPRVETNSTSPSTGGWGSTKKIRTGGCS